MARARKSSRREFPPRWGASETYSPVSRATGGDVAGGALASDDLTGEAIPKTPDESVSLEDLLRRPEWYSHWGINE